MSGGRDDECGPWALELDTTPPPGETLQEYMDLAGVSVWSMAAATGLSEGYLAGLLYGKFELTEHAAQELDKATGISARMWLRLEKCYQSALAAKRAKTARERPLHGLESTPDMVMDHVQRVLAEANVVFMDNPQSIVETFQEKLERITGHADQEVLDLAKHLIREAEVGVEPGQAFQIELPIGTAVYRFTLIRPVEE